MSGERHLTRRARELAPIIAEEDCWGQHPECPVEVLADGSQVWRVPPGTEVEMVITETYRYPVMLLDERPPVAASGYVRVQRTTGTKTWADWRELRRIGYTPASNREEAPEAAHAGR